MKDTLAYIYQHGAEVLQDFRNLWFEITIIQIITRVIQFLLIFSLVNIGIPYAFSATQNQELLLNFDLLGAVDIERLVIVFILCIAGIIVFYSLEILSLIVLSDAYYEGRNISFVLMLKEITSKLYSFFYSIALQIAIYSFATFLYVSIGAILIHFLPFWLALILLVLPTIRYARFMWGEFLRLTYVNFRIFDEFDSVFGLFDYSLTKKQLREIWVFALLSLSVVTLISIVYNSLVSFITSQSVLNIANFETVSLIISFITFVSVVLSTVGGAFVTAFTVLYRSQVYHEVFKKPNNSAKRPISLFKKSVLKLRYGIILTVLIVSGVFVGVQSQLLQTELEVFDNLEFIIMAHRGGDGLDNTKESIQDSIDQGFDAVEIDVQITQDGELVLFHDEFIFLGQERVAIYDATWIELQEFRFENGRGLILLEDAIETAGQDIGLNIEIKLYQERLTQETVDAFLEIEQIIPPSLFSMVISLDEGVINILESQPRDLETGLIITASVGDVNNVNADWLIINNIFYQANESAFEDWNGKVALWSFSQDWVGDYALAQGLDAAITDQPEDLQSFLGSYEELPEDQQLLQEYIWSLENRSYSF